MRLDCGVRLAFSSPLSSLRASKPLGPSRTGDTPEVPPLSRPQPKPPLPQESKLQSPLNQGPAWRRTDTYLVLLMDWASSCVVAPSGARNPEKQLREISDLFRHCFHNGLLTYDLLCLREGRGLPGFTSSGDLK